MKFKFTGSQPISSSVTSFIFESEQTISWTPGQYFHYLLPHQDEDDRGHERWFTCSSAPSEGRVVISTRIDSKHGSSFKRALTSLKPGVEIEADGPKGDFVRDKPDRNYIWVAGGIGITPFRAILVESRYKNQPLKVNLLYANRDASDIPFKDELDNLAQQNPDLKVEYIIEPARISAKFIKQRVDQTDDPLVYISGPEPMVKDLAEKLKSLGVADETLKLDDFPGYENY